jgi:hypothetical protein
MKTRNSARRPNLSRAAAAVLVTGLLNDLAELHRACPDLFADLIG